MPIVFVHGVNNREGDEYRDNEAGRNGFLIEIVAPALGLPANGVHIESPYWGGDGAKFAWGMAVLPDAKASYEQFGAGAGTEAFGRTVELVAELGLTGGIADHARQDFAGTVEALYGATLAGAGSVEEARAVARSYLVAEDYVAANPDPPSWLANADDENFSDLLNHYVYKDEGETFGAGGLRDKLKEGLSRLAGAVPAAGSALLDRLGRKKLNTTVTRFAGDIFVYLDRRGKPAPGTPGPIVKTVLDSLHRAKAKLTEEDNRLIVIAHSFGGEIVYDILTTFDRELAVDCLVTVGSQVGLFEEMKLYLASKADIPPHYPDGRVPRPPNLKRWLNVFDPNDILSYRIGPIFDQTEDYRYDTGYSTLQAHGGYFLRPSFYVRLAKRLQAAKPPQAEPNVL
jgi:hypothetical protein